jgi:hypothetical protein
LGCGTGLLWLENLERLPGGVELLLSDRLKPAASHAVSTAVDKAGFSSSFS